MSNPVGFVRHFTACNRHDSGHFVPFLIGEKRYGRIKKDIADLLSKETALFEPVANGLALAPRFDDFSSRSDALMQASRLLSAHTGKPLRNEMYAVVENIGDAPLAQIDRVAVPWFGLRAWGLHVNGYVRKKDGLYLWIGERAADRQVEPGKLDNLIGGGNPIGITLEQNLCKEAYEEAGIAPHLAQKAKLVRPLSYTLEMPDGLREDTLFFYDLDLPEDFAPRNTDGEVAKFTLLPLNEIADIVRKTDRFKFNCPLVIADFMIRHNFLTPQDPEYAELQKWLAPAPKKTYPAQPMK